MKKIIYVDMDGVISDFDKAAKEGGWTYRPDKHVDFRNLDLIEGAVSSMINRRYFNRRHKMERPT